MAKQAKTATQLGHPCEWSLFEPATASPSESAAQTTALQESTLNVTVGNAVSVLLHDKGKPLGLPFLSREKNRAPPPSCKRRSFVNHCSISTQENGPCPVSYSNPVYASHLFSDGSCWEILIIKQIHTFTSNILCGQQRFGLGFPSLYSVKWQKENEDPAIYSYFSLLSEFTGRSTW